MSCCASIVPIFQGLDEDSLEKISNIAKHTIIQKGEPLHNHGLFIIASGKAKVYSLTSSGHEQLNRILNPGDFIGLETLFGVEANYFVEALTEIMTCNITKEDFIALLNEYPSISIQLLSFYSKELIKAEERLLETSYESTTNRVMNYLTKLRIESNSNIVTIPMTLKELANFLSMSPESLSRSLKELEKTNEIKRIKIKQYKLFKQ